MTLDWLRKQIAVTLMVSLTLATLPPIGTAHAATTVQWENVPGGLKQVSADENLVWGVNSEGGIYRRPVDGSGAWEQVCCSLSNVSASGDGWVWGVQSGSSIWKCAKPCAADGSGWQRVDGSLVQVSGGKTHVWGVNSGGQIYRRPIDGSGAWEQVCCSLSHVAASESGWVWGVQSHGSIWKCEEPCAADGSGWQQVDGAAKSVWVDRDLVWALKSDDSIMRRPVDGSGAWETVPGRLASLASSSAGWLWGASSGGAIYKAAYGTEAVPPAEPTPAPAPTVAQGTVTILPAPQPAPAPAPTSCPAGQTLVRGSCVLMGEVVYLGCTPAQCAAGQQSGSDCTCVPVVKFHAENSLELPAAQALSAEKGWVMATADDVEAAWAQLGLDVFAYAMLDDGRFAVPVQADHGSIRRGANIGISGGNQGFLYVEAGAVTRTQAPPATATEGTGGLGTIVLQTYDAPPPPPFEIPTNAPKPVAGVVAASYCPPGVKPEDNWMIEKWPAEVDPPYLVSSHARRVVSNATLRDDLLVKAALLRLERLGETATDRNLQELVRAIKTDPVARYEFAPLMLRVFFDALVAPDAGPDWAYRTAFQTDKACDDYHRATITLDLWNEYQGQGILSRGGYDTVTLSSINFNHRPSVEGFAESDPLSFGAAGGQAVALLYMPMAAKAGVLEDNPLNRGLAKLGDEMTATAVAAGLGSAAGFAGVMMGTVTAYMSAAGAAIMANAVGGLQASLSTAQASLAALQASGASTEALAAATSQVANLSSAVSSATASSGASNFALTFSNLLGPAIVVVIAACILGMTVAEAAKRDAFEAKVREAASEFRTFDIEQFLSAPGEDPAQRRSALFTLMVKHLIADPADSHGLTLALPPIPVSEVADSLAATLPPAGGEYRRIQNNWYKDRYVHNQNGTLEVGTIAASWWSAQWVIVPVGDGWVRIQNRWHPDQYIHNQNGKLEVGPIQPNWWSAQWKLVPVSDDWVRIQNRWYPDRYIHNQNGVLEVGPIELNWASTLWKVQ